MITLEIPAAVWHSLPDMTHFTNVRQAISHERGNTGQFVTIIYRVAKRV